LDYSIMSSTTTL